MEFRFHFNASPAPNGHKESFWQKLKRSLGFSVGEVHPYSRWAENTLQEKLGRGDPEAFINELRNSGVRVHTETRQQFFVSDASGNEHEYNSLDEMPPELRTEMEVAMRNAKPVTHTEESFHFTLNNADGSVETYTSLEDLPPHVRAVYEKLRNK